MTASEVWNAVDEKKSARTGTAKGTAAGDATNGEFAGTTEHGARALAEAHAVAAKGAAIVRDMFPKWKVADEARSDAPTWALITRVDEWKPDLVVVGTHGRSALSRVVLGSVSQKVLSEAACSVRVARAPWTPQPAAVRVVVGIDGMHDSTAAVVAAARRVYPPGSAIHLLAAVNPLHASGSRVSFVLPEPASADDEEFAAIREQMSDATAMLAVTGAVVTSEMSIESPIDALLGVAHGWGADCIMVGSHGHGFFERLVLGSVSATLVNRAGCSIEIVRT